MKKAFPGLLLLVVLAGFSSDRLLVLLRLFRV